MNKLIIFAFTIALFSPKPAFSQQAFKLGLKQPPPLTITISETINATVGEVVNLDTYFNVEGISPIIGYGNSVPDYNCKQSIILIHNNW